MTERDQVWRYSFALWPDKNWKHEKFVFEVFRHGTTMMEFDWTEAQFNMARSALSHSGFSMREISRWTVSEREPVL